MKRALLVSPTEQAQEAAERLRSRYDWVDLRDADMVVGTRTTRQLIDQQATAGATRRAPDDELQLARAVNHIAHRVSAQAAHTGQAQQRVLPGQERYRLRGFKA